MCFVSVKVCSDQYENEFRVPRSLSDLRHWVALSWHLSLASHFHSTVGPRARAAPLSIPHDIVTHRAALNIDSHTVRVTECVTPGRWAAPLTKGFGMTGNDVDAMLSIRRNGRLLIGRERITLLEAVARHGSITKAAEAAGFSYKTAWDAVNSINNLLPRPAFITRAGGDKGGGAVITEEGHRLIAAFRQIEEKLAQISSAIAEEGLNDCQDALFWGLGVKISARNSFRCQVLEVKKAPVDVEVVLKVSERNQLVVTVTNRSVTELGLEPGRTVMAFVKAPLVMILPGDAAPDHSGRNEFRGTVIYRADGEANAEITVDIGEGKTITAVIARESADGMALAPGAEVWALFKPSHVILATN